MKSIACVLMLVIMLHAHCGVNCMGAEVIAADHSATPSKESDCHRERSDTPGVPPGNPSPHHESNDGCSQAQLLDGRSEQISKWLGCATVADFRPSASLDEPATGAVFFSIAKIALDSSPPPSIVILRI